MFLLKMLCMLYFGMPYQSCEHWYCAALHWSASPSEPAWQPFSFGGWKRFDRETISCRSFLLLQLLCPSTHTFSNYHTPPPTLFPTLISLHHTFSKLSYPSTHTFSNSHIPPPTLFPTIISLHPHFFQLLYPSTTLFPNYHTPPPHFFQTIIPLHPHFFPLPPRMFFRSNSFPPSSLGWLGVKHQLTYLLSSF